MMLHETHELNQFAEKLRFKKSSRYPQHEIVEMLPLACIKSIEPESSCLI